MQRNGWAAMAAGACVAGVLGLAPVGAPWGPIGSAKAQAPQDDPPKVAANETKSADEPAPENVNKTAPELATSEEEALDRLEQRMDFDFQDTPLSEVAEYLTSRIGVQILFGKQALDAEGISPDTPVTLQVRKVKASKGLELALRSLGGGSAPLAYYLEDGLLFITTEHDPAFIKRDLRIQVYNCRDLLRLESFKPAAVVEAAEADPKAVAARALRIVEAKLSEEAGARPSAAEEAAQELIAVLKTVRPDSWDDVGEQGSIRAFNGLVTVRAKREVHQELEELLSMLRDSVQDELGK